ncbi:MAG TPA: aminotransferase class III-fold pyridoxal phosphate-dependent enzyme [Saprospiraceae bacterium]|nr:aminotransferase class III-fold pyridoxal phosphate-dependent enzyme [Saprospiraceae bacterium]HMQ85105.1 aminotransferase class III-fold pyridoxal phosphate-dependent enzyme [Saprospiraceae bacterium]
MTEVTSGIDLLSPVWTHLTQIQPVRGEGIYLYDAAENCYLDFTAGIGVVSTGHCHPRVVSAIQEQAAQLLFGQINCVLPQPTVLLAEKLKEVTPTAIDRFFISNSGAEATEAAIKLAKATTGRPNVIVFQGSFHGRSHLAMAMTTSRTAYRQRYQPLPGGIFVAPFPYTYYYGWDEETTVSFCLKQLNMLLYSQTAPEETAAIIIEPILGEGGYVPAPPAFLRALRQICDQHGILLIMDEVQTGFGRTGRFFYFEYADLIPDVIVMAKGLGSGLPISAVGATAAVMDKWLPGAHGGTYGGGSAIASAAACATIDVIQDEGLVQNAAARGQQLIQSLQALQERFPVMGDVRGKGLMVAVEFTTGNEPDAAIASAVQKACLKRNLMLLSCGTFRNVIRWIPPLLVNAAQIEAAVGLFEAALYEVVKQKNEG